MTEITFTQILQLVRRWWWILVIVPVIAGGAAWVLTDRSTPVYEADMTMLVDSTRSSESTSSIYNDILAAERLSKTYGQLVTTRVIMEEAIARLGLAGWTAEDLQDVISVKTVPDTQLITISASDTDPNRAAQIANTVAQVFIDQTNTLRPELSASNSEALQQSIDDIASDMAQTAEQIATLEARPDADSAPVQAEIRELRTLLGEDQSRHAELVEIQQRMTLAEAESGVQVTVVDPAVPAATPVSPKPLFNTLLAIIGAVIIAGGIVFVLGYLDNTVKTPEDVQRLTGKATIGMIPMIDRPELFAAMTDMRSEGAEAFRGLRTNLQFAALGRNVGSIVVTSSNPEEGKTTVALYLGMVLAQGGLRVILLDADLRRPGLHRLAGLPNRAGLTNLLLADSDEDIREYLQWTDVNGLQILPTGPLPPNPADVLNSRRMEETIHRLEALADIVLIDTAPASFSDAPIIASMVDGIVLVSQAGGTRTNDLADAVAALDQTGTPLIGTVLNKMDTGHDAYRRRHQYTPGQEEAATMEAPLNSNRRRGIAGLFIR